MIPVNNNGRRLLLVETPSNSQVGTSRAATYVVTPESSISFSGSLIFLPYESERRVGRREILCSLCEVGEETVRTSCESETSICIYLDLSHSNLILL